jgi:OmpA-OmpF porin, OOP family
MANRIIFAGAAVSAVALSLGVAATQANALPGYVTDQRGEVVKSAFGLCYHTRDWRPELAIEACDPDFVPKRVVVTTPPAPVRPAPAPIVAAPVAPPVAVPVVLAPPPAPRKEKVALSADTLFTFGKADLRPTAIDKLDGLVAKLKGVDPENIVVTGHTDRLGSPAYNNELSLRRAEAIKTYLVAKGVEPKEITLVSKGESEPVTKASECSGPKNPKLIACLQPDRRVEIELVGTRLR